MSEVRPQQIALAFRTDPGRVREHNEDDLGDFADAEGQRLFVVADGMGGHKGGATASHLAVEVIGESFQQSGASPAATLQAALEAANREVHQRSLRDPELRGMGTTAVVLLVDADGRGWAAHVGDSRIYRLRDGRMEVLTEDHSVVGEMMRQGLLSEEDAAVHPRRNEILRSVGVEPSVQPEIREVDVQPGDVFLLCSDGLSGLVQGDEMAALLQADAPERAVQALVDLANERGGPDNVTVQVVSVPEAGSAAAEATSESAAEAAAEGSGTLARSSAGATQAREPAATRAGGLGWGWIALAVVVGAAATVALAWWQGVGPFEAP